MCVCVCVCVCVVFIGLRECVAFLQISLLSNHASDHVTVRDLRPHANSAPNLAFDSFDFMARRDLSH